MEVEEPQQDKDDALQLQQLSYYKKWARRLAKARPRALSVAEILASQQLLVTGLPDGTTEVLSAVCYNVITFQSNNILLRNLTDLSSTKLLQGCTGKS